MNDVQQLQRMNACSSAIDFVKNFPTLQAAWNLCERPDWMFWLLARTVTGKNGSETHRALVRVSARCAMLAPPIEDKRFKELEVARQWACDAALQFGNGEDNRDECAYAAYAVAAYAAAATAAWRGDAAWRAAADDAAAAAAAAAIAAWRDDAAADADAADADAAAWRAAAVRKDCSNIIRSEFAVCPLHPDRG